MKKIFSFTFLFKGAVSVFIILGLLLVLPSRAEAVVIDNDGQIGAGETINDDVFLSGRIIVVDGTVNGSLFVSGESININGVVNGDLFVSGRTINLSDKSAVGGNLFISGQNILINGKVNSSVFIGGASADIGPSANIMRNVFIGGFSVSTAQGSRIGRDLLIGAYQAIVKGDIAKDLKIGAGAVEVTGKIGGDLIAEIGDSNQEGNSFFPLWGRAMGLPDPIQPGLRIGNEAKINGKISYVAPGDQLENIKAQPLGGITYKTPEPDKDAKAPAAKASPVTAVLSWIFDRIRLLITLLLFGGLVVWLTPNYLDKATEKVRSTPFPAVWKGFLTILVGYVVLGAAFLVLIILVVVVNMATLKDLSTTLLGLGGSGLGVIASTFGAIVGYISKIIIAFLVGDLIIKKYFTRYESKKIWAMILGIFIYVLIRSIPLLGWLVGVAVTLAGMGALWLLLDSIRKKPAPATLDTASV
jgi:hypothetical protein